MAMESRALAIEGLRKTRGSPTTTLFELEVPALHVRPGELLAVVGDSGCGKSTLLDVLALVSRPSEVARFGLAGARGRYDISELWRCDREADLARVRAQDIGYVLQTGGLLPFLTVRRNAELAFAVQGRRADADRIVELAAKLDIADQLEKLPKALSGGQRQRAAILRALANGPSIVLADEPTAAVDPKRAQSIVADLRTLATDENVAVVMVTHDHRLADRFAHRRLSFEITEVSPAHVRSTAVPMDTAAPVAV